MHLSFSIPLLAFESIAFYMVLRKAYDYLRDRRFITGIGVEPHSSPSHLISVLFRDSLLYFAG